MVPLHDHYEHQKMQSRQQRSQASRYLAQYQLQLANAVQWILSEEFQKAMNKLHHLPKTYEEFLATRMDYQQLFEEFDEKIFSYDAYDLLMHYDFFPRHQGYEQRMQTLVAFYPQVKKRYHLLEEKAFQYQTTLGKLEEYAYSLESLLAEEYSLYEAEKIARNYTTIASYLDSLLALYHRDSFFASLNSMITKTIQNVLSQLAEELLTYKQFANRTPLKGYYRYLYDNFTHVFGKEPSLVMKEYQLKKKNSYGEKIK